jgi:Rieske Fe-S protein
MNQFAARDVLIDDSIEHASQGAEHHTVDDDRSRHGGTMSHERQTPDSPEFGANAVGRRTVLTVVAVGAGGVALAACGGGSGGSSNTSDPATNTSSGTGGSQSLAPLSSVPVGGSVAAKDNGKPIVLAQPQAGTVVAFSAICTHMGCTVNAGGAQLHCPCHGSVYNAFTGAVISGPAPKALPAVQVRVQNGFVVSG